MLLEGGVLDLTLKGAGWRGRVVIAGTGVAGTQVLAPSGPNNVLLSNTWK